MRTPLLPSNIETFAKHATIDPNALLQAGDPPPVQMHVGNTMVIFTGPHNGRDVPQKLYKEGLPLGLPHEFFKSGGDKERHELVDIGVGPFLFPALKKTYPNASFLEANYTRDVTDPNRTKDWATRCINTIGEGEFKHPIFIPKNRFLNTAGDLDTQQRLNEIYDPYHQAEDLLIQHIKKQHNDQVLLIDLHSFTPKENRADFGLLDPHKHPAAQAFLEEALQRAGLSHIPNEPFNLDPCSGTLISQIAVGRTIAERNKIYYVGFEFNNTLLTSEESVQQPVDFILDFIEQVTSATNRNQLLIPTDDAFTKQPLNRAFAL